MRTVVIAPVLRHVPQQTRACCRDYSWMCPYDSGHTRATVAVAVFRHVRQQAHACCGRSGAETCIIICRRARTTATVDGQTRMLLVANARVLR